MFLVFLRHFAYGQDVLPPNPNEPARDRAHGDLPRLLAPFFRPPPEDGGQLGSYRSPLQFEDGTLVKTPVEWARRREEILKRWHGLMGPWPPILEAPKLEFLSLMGPASRPTRGGLVAETKAGQTTTHAGERPVSPPRENFARHRVRLEIAPGQTGDGWLLVPDGKGPFPAVLAVYDEPETTIGLGKERLRDFGLQLARRGFVTLSMGTPGGNAWKPELGAAQCQPLSYHAYVAANCWQALARLPQSGCGAHRRGGPFLWRQVGVVRGRALGEVRRRGGQRSGHRLR